MARTPQSATAMAVWSLSQIERLGRYVLNFGFGDVPAAFEKYCGKLFTQIVMFSVGLGAIALAVNLVVVQVLGPLAAWIFGSSLTGDLSGVAKVVVYAFYVAALLFLALAVYSAWRGSRFLNEARALSEEADKSLAETGQALREAKDVLARSKAALPED